MAQKNIDFGTYPDDPDADAIRSAFQKTQENFNEIFAGLSDQGVLSINKTPQAGITVSGTTGNVLITANLSCVTVQSNTLQLTINNGSPGTTQIIDSASKILQINFPVVSNIPNANIAGNLLLGGWANIANGNIILQNGNITATGNVVSANGNFSGNLNVSGNIANANNIAVSNVLSGNTANFSGNLVAANLITAGVANVANLNVTANITSNLLPNANITYDLGSGSQRWGNLFANNINITGNITTAANANLGNLVTANFYTGTITTNSQPNITSLGTLASLTVSGNANVGNLGSGLGIFTSNVTAANVYANSGTIGASLLTGTLTTNAQPNVTSVGTLSSLSVAANITSGNANLGNLATANFFQGDGYLLSNLSVAAGTYISNGISNVAVTSSGGNVIVTVGATTNAVVFTSNGVNIAGYANILGNANIGNVGATRFVGNLEGSLLTNAQTNITSLGTLTGLSVNGVSTLGANGNVIITGGVANSFLMTNGSGNLSWNTATLVPAQGLNAQIIFNDGGSNYAGNTGFTFIKATGNVAIPGALDVVGNINGANLSSPGTLNVTGNANVGNIGAGAGSFTSLIVNGPINAGNISGNVITGNSFVGNGSGLSALAGANVTGQVANALVAGTVYTAAQPNITSVGTLTSLGVNGTVTGVAFTANTGVFTGNGSGLSALNASNITTGTLAQARLANANLTLGNTTLTLGATTTTVAGLTSVTSTTFVGALTGAATTAGTVTTNAQPNITSVGTLTSLGVNGTVTAVAFTANTGVFTGNGAGLTNIPAGNINGQVANALIAGTVYTAAQPNITSVGTLTSLTSSGNISAANVVATSYHIRSVATGISAAGSTQGAATALTKEINIVSTVSAGANGVILPTAVAGMVIIINNTSATSLNVYPATGGAINSGATNAAFTHVAGSSLQYYASNNTQWYTVGATYA